MQKKNYITKKCGKIMTWSIKPLLPFVSYVKHTNASCHQELSKRTIRSRSLLTKGQFVINYFDLPHNQSDERIRLPQIFLQKI
jgi:hypothetical protein